MQAPNRDGNPVLALSDAQLEIVMTAAGGLSPEKRRYFSSTSQLRDLFTDKDLDDAVRVAVTGLIQSAA